MLVLAISCGGVDAPHPQPPVIAFEDAGLSYMVDALEDAPVEVPAAPIAAETWLRGSTHVHARPSGDSTAPIPEVIAWYETRGYDFIVLTDHNQVSELDPRSDTTGQVTVRNPPTGLIVFAGIELTYNPNGCLPAGDANRKCRIHVNLVGATSRPGGKIEWADRTTRDRVAKYQAALVAAKTIGGIAQVNHPSWFWGMTPDVLAEIARRGVVLYELWNVQFTKWNTGDKDHPSTEAIWDTVLGRGVTLWAVATDDAHNYGHGGKYPAGGGWVAVKARRDPQAILDSLAAGKFYASTGVTLERAEVDNGELVVEVAATDAEHVIEFVENGKLAITVKGKSARRAVPAAGYLRAVVTRSDGAKAWVQPARR